VTQVEQLVAIAAQLTVLGAAAAGALLWFKRWLRRQVSEPLETVRGEVEVNKGDSMHDAVIRTEGKIAVLVTRFEDHMRMGHAAPAAPPVVVVERPARDA
jgi:hypothetical protein